jgi:eukaryotic-like serine/threonine-protein kinase
VTAPSIEHRARRAQIERVVLGRATATVLLGRFELGERLGAGAMGAVYAARDPELDRKVALKLLVPGLPSERLRHEARALARLSHPHVVHVHEIGEHQGRAFIVMELVDGSSMAQWLAEGPRSWRDVVRAFIDAGRALAAAHAVGVIHRDFKIDNVLVDRTGHVRVADFGLATTPHDLDLAAEGEPLVGTPRYAAPELRTGVKADARSDQYSFCRAALDVFSGRDGDVAPAPPRAVLRALARGCAEDPARRWPTLDPLLAHMAAASAQPRRGPWIVAGVAVMAMLALRLSDRERSECDRMADEIHDAWPESTRDQLRRQETTETPSTVGVLDRYVDRWLDTHRSLCGAPEPDRTAAAELCLRGRARTLGDVVIMATAKGGSPSAFLDAALALPAPEDCARHETLAASALDPAVELALAHARALSLVQRIEEAAQAYGRTTALARAGNSREGLARALVEEGAEHTMRRRWSAGAAALEEGFWIAHERGLSPEAARAAMMLAARDHGPDDAAPRRIWLRLALTAARRTDVPATVLAGALAVAAEMERAAGRTDAALAGYDEALRALAGEANPPPVLLASLRNDRALALLDAGRLEEAEQQLTGVVETTSRTLGWHHASVASALLSRGILHLEAGRHEAARTDFQHSADIYAEAGDPRSEAGARLNAARSLRALGRPQEAALQIERALADLQAHDVDDAVTGLAHANLADSLAAEGRHQDVRRHAEQALAIYEAHGGARNPQVLPVLVMLAQSDAATGDLLRARENVARARAIAETLSEPRRHEALALLRELGTRMGAADEAPR